ncbi:MULTISPECIES: hypothetical protein [Ralstonia solanacearum species complex]|nr:fragment of putative drug/metabolite exporter (part 2) [Ralstonia solanacearum K60]
MAARAAAAYGIIALEEALGWAHGVALVCVVAGILVASWPDRAARAHSRSAGPARSAAGPRLTRSPVATSAA